MSYNSETPGNTTFPSIYEMDNTKSRRPVTVLGAALAIYWVVIFTATHWPNLTFGIDGAVLPVDLVLHFLAYSGLSIALTTFLVARARWRWLPRHSIMAVCVIALYGALDEVTQMFVRRHTSAVDWAADVLGAVAGTLCVAAIAMWARRKLSAQRLA